ncbi:hypothetical protein Cflav_PD5735 [Pedosphaera parvula Ellin514]|uniref:Uncharacterized protein n=1 Tax=Pedosphaera parvula (strain Ellin514) TaxID=320771 RepID=B9XAR5_PEDPL|nr:hypothetical protein Cflav_PD5735 [Pedosphaera parvula Ellin514]
MPKMQSIEVGKNGNVELGTAYTLRLYDRGKGITLLST